MKRIGNLYEKAFTLDALYQAYLDASRSKRGRKSQLEFSKNLGFNLVKLQKELKDRSYEVQPYKSFTVYEPKQRTIYAPAFRDCIVQHAIYNVILPIFDKTFIDQSYACRVGKGGHQASDYTQESLRKLDKNLYTLKLDIRKFFYRVNRNKLRSLCSLKIKDREFLDLMMKFAVYDSPTGIPIGNLLSQLFALIYMNPVDHFVKRDLKVKHYVRYVDDFILMGLNLEQARDYKAQIEKFIREELNLELSKFSISKVSKGLNFVGYRTWASKRFIRRRALQNFRRAVLKGELNSVISFLAHARNTHSLRHLFNYIEVNNYELYRILPESCQRWHYVSTD